MTLEIIDAHVHAYPSICGKRNEMLNTGESYGRIRRARRGAWRPGGKRGVVRFAPPSFHPNSVSAELLLEYMSWAGIDKAVLLQAPMYGDHNEYLAEVTRKYSDRFVSYGLVDPRDGERALEGLEYIKSLGHVGVKIEAPDTPFWMDDGEFDRFWAKIQELDLICGVDLGWDGPDNPYNFQLERFEKIVKRFPDTRYVLLHLGVSYLWDISQEYPFPVLQKTLQLSKYPNVWFELSGLQEFCEGEQPPRNDYPFPRAQEIVRLAVETVGADRVIWGSDFPGILLYCTYPQTLNLIRYCCDFLGDREKELILSKNAEELYEFGKR